MKHSKTKILLLSISVVFVVVMLIVPLISVLMNSLAEGWDFYVKALTTPYVLSALRLTLIATVIAVIVNTVFGLCAAWAISKFDFRGKHLLTTLIDIPFSVSPVIAGLAFIMTFGRMGWIGQWIEVLNDYLGTDIQIVFAVPGVILATIFVTIPFVFRESSRSSIPRAAMKKKPPPHGGQGEDDILPHYPAADQMGLIVRHRPLYGPGPRRVRCRQRHVETAGRNLYFAP